MAGGDYALIKSVEGFEDFAPFGRKQVVESGLTAGDTVFAISEGGETSFVIGTAQEGVEAGARVFFVYNNPDDVLRAHVRRSRDVLDDPRIVKINLTTGPMAVTGSTRMQATSIELLAMLTVLEMVLRRLLGSRGALGEGVGAPDSVPAEMRSALAQLHAGLTSVAVLQPLARLVETEERNYRAGGRTSYFAESLAVDVLTDTTERSPTFCTPSFRKWDDTDAAESWAFLFTAAETTEAAWPGLLRRAPRTIDWGEEDLRPLLDEDAVGRQAALVRQIGSRELMRFRIGLDGIAYRPFRKGDAGIVVASGADIVHLASSDAAFTRQLDAAAAAGAERVLVAAGREAQIRRLLASAGRPVGGQICRARVARDAVPG